MSDDHRWSKRLRQCVRLLQTSKGSKPKARNRELTKSWCHAAEWDVHVDLPFILERKVEEGNYFIMLSDKIMITFDKIHVKKNMLDGIPSQYDL